ncbi:MAG: hypothetical protein ACJ77O_03290 [Chloroflexota bacterium]
MASRAEDAHSEDRGDATASHRSEDCVSERPEATPHGSAVTFAADVTEVT